MRISPFRAQEAAGGNEMVQVGMGNSPILLVPTIGVIVIGFWGDGFHLATYTGDSWLVDVNGELEYRQAPRSYFLIAETLAGADEYGVRQQ